MALPATVVNVNTAGWSDHRNQNHGGIQQTLLTNEAEDDGTFYNLGDSAEHVGNGTAITAADRGRKLLRLRFYFQRVGNPTGNISVVIRPPTNPLDPVPDFSATPLSTSQSFPCSSIPTTGKNEVIFSFPIPPIISATDSFLISVITISVQGDASNYIKVYRRSVGSAACGSRAYGSSTWVEDVTRELSYRMEVSQPGAFVFGLDKTNNKARAYKTTDNGATWAEQSSGTVPSILTTSGMKSLAAQGFIQDLNASYVGLFTGGVNAGFYSSPPTVWALIAQKAFGAVGTNVSTTGPIGGGRRANGNLVVIVQGATETVMGSARRRIKLAFWNGSTWSNEFDVVGSTNTPNATLPGDAADHEYRWSIVDPNGDCHIVYSKSDTSTLQYRKFTSANVFTTINTLNGAVASATANYPVGQGTILYKSPDWYIAIPYVDNTSSTLKEARCKTTDTATSANWVLTEIVAASAEVSGSNPALLMADNSQGGKVFCWRVVPTTKKLKFTDDSGSSTWKPETDWKGGAQVVGGISGLYLEDGIALVYLEEGTTPDELRYDRL